MTSEAGKNEAAGSGNPRGNHWRLAGWCAAALVLLLPLLADAPWTASDFIVMGALLGGVGLGLELAVRKRDPVYTMAAGVALAASFLLVWINGAVGIIGSERDDANLLFAGVLLVALGGAVLALFRPAGMARAMVAAALAQALVPVIAAAVRPGSNAWAPEVLGLTAGFVALWLGSAWLFRRAADGRTPAGAAP